MQYETRLTIDGALVEGSRSLEVVNPATGKVLATVSCASPEQLEAAVQAAKRAQPAWEALGWSARADMLRTIADRMEARREDFADVMVAEQGKPRHEAMDETVYAIAFIRHFAKMELRERFLAVPTSGTVALRHKALGVVAGISPWNFPLLIPAAKIAPALLAGNTMVMKPAPTTPILTLMIGEIAASVLPPGVLNVITDQNDLGDLLTSHRDIAKITFTGSTATGRRIMASAAPTLKRLTLELGGNDAAIVLEDVNVQETAQRVFAAAFSTPGRPVSQSSVSMSSTRSTMSSVRRSLDTLATQSLARAARRTRASDRCRTASSSRRRSTSSQWPAKTDASPQEAGSPPEMATS